MRTGEAMTKARTLVEALPYIREYRNRVVVVKVGGEAVDDAASATRVAEDLALLSFVGVRVVVVHGGGPQISRAMQVRGLEPRFVDGLRITDDVSMEVVQQVLIGDINARIVGMLNQVGAAAVGVSGIDASCIVAEAVTSAGGRSLGRVGLVAEVKPAYLLSLLEQGFTPVVASVAPTSEGIVHNVNADAAAAGVAAALQAEKLVFVTNVEGLYRDLGDRGSLMSEIKRDELAALLPALSSGMRPKAGSALAAIDGGVAKVHIIDGRVDHALLLEIFTPEGIGTQVLA